MVLRSATSSPRSAASFSARPRNSGTTDPSSIAVRSDCSASSGRTSSAGGVRRAGALQRRQHLDDFGTARIERAADLLLAAVERAQPRLGIADPGLDAAHLGGDVDQLLIELAAILPDRRDIGLQFLLQLGGLSLLLAGGLEFLLALLDGVGRGGASPAASRRRPARIAGESETPAKLAENSGMEARRGVNCHRGRRCRGTNECPALSCIQSIRRSLYSVTVPQAR